MKTIFSTGTMLILFGLCLNTVAAEPLQQDQRLDGQNSSTDNHTLQENKQFDLVGHKIPANVKHASIGVEQPVDDDCE